MKFKRDQVIKCANEANKLYTVIGYNAGGNIILIPHGSEKSEKNEWLNIRTFGYMSKITISILYMKW
ncbi:hypothetical protein BSL056_09170 [Bacillus safensis]|nr:hypothetical protein BSL056_09170 [Bacillus safensis]